MGVGARRERRGMAASARRGQLVPPAGRARVQLVVLLVMAWLWHSPQGVSGGRWPGLVHGSCLHPAGIQGTATGITNWGSQVSGLRDATGPTTPQPVSRPPSHPPNRGWRLITVYNRFNAEVHHPTAPLRPPPHTADVHRAAENPRTPPPWARLGLVEPLQRWPALGRWRSVNNPACFVVAHVST